MIQNANTGIRPMTKATFLNSEKDSILIEALLPYCYLSSAPDATFSWGLVQKHGSETPLRTNLIIIIFYTPH